MSPHVLQGQNVEGQPLDSEVAPYLHYTVRVWTAYIPKPLACPET